MAAAKTPATTTMSAEERIANIRKAAQISNAPAWLPEKDDLLIGELVGVRKGESEYGVYPVLVFKELETGEYTAFHAFHGMARDRMAELKPSIGTVMNILYLGTRETNKTKGSDDPTVYNLYVINLGDGSEVVNTLDTEFDFS